MAKTYLSEPPSLPISNPSLGNVGFRNSNPVHFRFIQKDSTVVMDIVNTELLTTAEPTKEMAASIKQNYKNLSFLSFPIKGWSKDSASVLIDASSFFLKDNRFFPVIEGSSSGIEVQEEQRDDLTHIKTLKSFKNNVSILVERSYKATFPLGLLHAPSPTTPSLLASTSPSRPS